MTRKVDRDVRLPPGYRIIQGGQVESQNEVFGTSSSRWASR